MVLSKTAIALKTPIFSLFSLLVSFKNQEKMTELKTNDGRLIATYTSPMDVTCMHCKKAIVTGDGLFMAVGEPYHGCLHRTCAPYFSFDGIWPHPQPRAFYLVTRT